MPVDAHVHFWRLADDHPIAVNRRIAGIERDFMPSDLKPLCEVTGVEKVVLVQAAASVAETNVLLNLAAEEPLVTAVVGWVDIEDEDCGDHLDRFEESPKFSGVRLMAADMADPNWLVKPNVLRGARMLAQRGLVAELLVRPTQLEAVVELLDAVPELRANINHCARPLIVAREWQPWADRILAIAERPTVNCKYSGLIERGGFEWSVEMLRPVCRPPRRDVRPDADDFCQQLADHQSRWELCALVGRCERGALRARALERRHREHLRRKR